MSDKQDKKSSGLVGVGIGAAAAVGTGYATTTLSGNAVITEALAATDKAFQAGGSKIKFADAVRTAASAPFTGSTPFKDDVTRNAGEVLKKANEILKPAEVIKVPGEALAKAPGDLIKSVKATRGEALTAIRTGLKGHASVLANIHKGHAAAVVVGSVALGLAAKKLSDKAFGSKAEQVEAGRAAGSAQLG